MDNNIEIFIVRDDDDLTSEQLKQQLEQLPDWDSSIRLDVRMPEHQSRQMDPSFLSAICTVGGTVLGALISSLLNAAQARGKQKITIQFPNGSSIEVEGRNATETLNKLLPLIESKTIIKL